MSEQKTNITLEIALKEIDSICRQQKLTRDEHDYLISCLSVINLEIMKSKDKK